MERSHERGAMRIGRIVIGSLVAGFCVWNCGTELTEAGTCTYTFECQVGEVCSEGRCVPSSHFVAEGAGGEGGEPGVGGSNGGAGTGGPGGAGGSGGSGDEEPGPRVTFAPNDYRRCFDSLECAVFGGNCLVELPLSRPLPDGTDRVKISDIDPSFEEGEGICGAPCTNEPRICDSLVVTGPEGQSRPSTCQLLYIGESPYPADPPAFPFVLDPQAMARGVPHAAICRPPFQHAEAHSPSFCAPCTEAAQCGDGDACWLDRPFTNTPSGACVQACELHSDCPFGFRCTDVDGDDPFLVGEAGSYCLPLAGTCGRCLDRDGDQRGVGTCGPLDEPFTEVDCDDANPDAYFDPARPAHPFPRFCGEFDFNCNGISDQVEQLGSEQHCAFCGDACAGAVPQGLRGCTQGDAGWACTALCQPGFADCNGDVEDGCETELEDGMLWARDRDGDGRGSPLELRYFCDGDVPVGWVQNTLDCDDGDPSRFGGGVDMQGLPLAPALEICDGRDNDCNNLVDDGTVVAVDGDGNVIGTAGEACDTGLDGVCGEGSFACLAGEGEGMPAAMVCVPNRDPSVQVFAPEVCNGLDDNCNGEVDEGADWYADRGQSNPEGDGAPVVCEVPGAKGICAFGVYTCGVDANGEPGWICQPNEPEDEDPMGDGIDQNCDGIDGVLEGSVFVRPLAGGGTLNGNDANDGSAQAPVASLARAIELACEGRPAGAVCRDIYLDQGNYVSDAAVEIPSTVLPGGRPLVRIYGGFGATIACEGDACALTWERGPNVRSVIVREAPALGEGEWPYGKRYAAIVGTGNGPMELLLDRVDVEVLAPDPAAMLPEGSSAPAQVGLECPKQGCGRLVLKDVEIRVEDGLNGTAGSAGAMGAFPDKGNNGRNGCEINDTNCDQGITYRPQCYGDESYHSDSTRDYRTEPATCADGKKPFGGSSGGVGCGGTWGVGPFGTGWLFPERRNEGFPGGGNPASWSGPRGVNGALGAGGYYVGSATFHYDEGPSWVGLKYQEATWGRSGGGGKGGNGWAVSFIQLQSLVRGGGGGAGGCNGTEGGRGGDGGSAIGMVLIAPPTGDLQLETPGAFAVRVGRGGSGGSGGAGGAGAAGGWGGSGAQSSDPEAYRGAEGGDGGGGGGGGGGHGGASIGIWRVCNRAGGTPANGCGIHLPPLLRASPDLFVAPGQAGSGGKGGEGGKRGEKTMHMSQRKDVGAEPATAGSGQAGVDGQRHFLFFSGGGQ